MTHCPVGVFDSGLGGLSAVRELIKLLPQQKIIYLGDTARVPYGTRSEKSILRYTSQAIRFFQQKQVRMILIACGTVSSVALESLKQESRVPMIGIIEPTVKQALALTRNRKIGIIATPATIRSGAFHRALTAAGGPLQIWEKACPMFVPLVENGYIDRDDPVAALLIAEYLAPLKQAGIDTLILGCTHYPLIAPAIAKFMGPEVRLVNSGKALANAFAASLPPLSSGPCEEKESAADQYEFYVSDTAAGFQQCAQLFLDGDVLNHVEKVDLEAMR